MPRMAPTVSMLARQTMRTAFEDLERTISPVDLKQMRSMSAIEQVRESALEIEKQLAARQTLRNMRRLAPLFRGLEHYSKAIEILCNGTPFLSWIWSPITLILKVASDHIGAFEHIIKGYSRISEALGRFEILGEAFRHDTTFQYTLAVYYSDILEFHKHAYRFVRRSGWHLLFHTSWGRFQRRFDGILEDLDRHADLIDREANARNISVAQRKRDESYEKLEQEERLLGLQQYQSVVAWLKLDENEQTKILESIHEEGLEFSGTCSWASGNGRIAAWLKNTPNDRQLWLQGNAGTGKSVLSSELIKFLRASKSTVFYHFCRYTYAESTKYDNILKSLIQQLLLSCGELTAYAYQEYVVGKKTTTTANLEGLLRTSLTTLSEASKLQIVWIVIDGIDDCETEKQTRLISLLYGLTSQSASENSTVCKILFTSRTHPTKTKRLSKKHVVSLGDEIQHISKAINLYTSVRLRSLHGRLRELEMSAEDVERIGELVTAKAAGMFLYARLVVDYLSTNVFFSAEELKQSINRLPATVEEFYQNILAHMLARLDSRSTGRVRCLLGWIAFARRPLKRLELLSALAFSSGSADTSSTAPGYILDLCSPFIEEKHDTTFAFIHGSVKEFLQTPSSSLVIDERTALQEHGLATVACLLSAAKVFREDFDKPTRLLRLVKGVHGLHVYATEHWADYLLTEAAAVNGLAWSSSLLDVSCSLAAQLSQICEPVAHTSVLPDDRLKLFDSQSNLQMHMSNALLARSQKSLEAHILLVTDRESCLSTDDKLKDGISLILDEYQKAVEILMDRESCPGASIEELRSFKSQFRSSAYTCRLRACPRATLGFDTEQLRREHETGHVGGHRCPVAGCQYPPFRTAQTLRVHHGKHHAAPVLRKPIRRVGRLAKNTRQKSSSTIQHADIPGDPPLLLTGNEVRPQTSQDPDPQKQGVAAPTKKSDQLRTETILEGSLDNNVFDASLTAGNGRSTNAPRSPLARLKLTNSPAEDDVSFAQSAASPPRLDSSGLGEPISTEVDESSTVKCICGFADDDGHTVLCEKCDTWQHVICYYPSLNVPDVHDCTECLPRDIDVERAIKWQREQHEGLTADELEEKPATNTGDQQKKTISNHQDSASKATPEGKNSVAFREKAAMYLRHRLQKGFLTPDQAPKKSDMSSMADLFTKLEELGDIEADILKKTKVHKVLKGIIRLDTIPRDEKFLFRVRSRNLLKKYTSALAMETDEKTETLEGHHGTDSLTTPVPYPESSLEVWRNESSVFLDRGTRNSSLATEASNRVQQLPSIEPPNDAAKTAIQNQGNDITQMYNAELSPSNQLTPSNSASKENQWCVVKCTCNQHNLSGNDLICLRCKTWQHKTCYKNNFPLYYHRTHLCRECSPSEMANLIIREHVSHHPRSAPLSREIIAFLNSVVTEYPQSYPSVLEIFQILKESQADRHTFMETIKELVPGSTLLMIKFLNILTKISTLGEIAMYSFQCIYCMRETADPLSSCIKRPTHHGEKRFHESCLIFPPNLVVYCTACTFESMASSLDSSLNDSRPSSDWPISADYGKSKSDPSDYIDGGDASYEADPSITTYAPYSYSLESAPTDEDVLANNVAMYADTSLALTPFLNTPNNMQEQEREQSGSSQSVTGLPSFAQPSLVDDARRLAEILGIDSRITIPSLRVIHGDIWAGGPAHDLHTFHRFIIEHTFVPVGDEGVHWIDEIVRKILPAVASLIHYCDAAGKLHPRYGLSYAEDWMASYSPYPQDLGPKIDGMEELGRSLVERWNAANPYLPDTISQAPPPVWEDVIMPRKLP
ncbi:unnamed protein product [Periconia digitata]|uniref:NACHT domain-containing protein n=1 Tax=Periconia digitata TaxID=1303443 RepID=A0A9W4XPY3_9PLEO|nr:unnamed protein product [Periconia digitata]